MWGVVRPCFLLLFALFDPICSSLLDLLGEWWRLENMLLCLFGLLVSAHWITRAESRLMDNTSYFDDQCVQVDGQPQPLKCITCNCQYLPKKYNAVADLSPDIIFLQSTCLQSMNNKKEFLDGNHVKVHMDPQCGRWAKDKIHKQEFWLLDRAAKEEVQEASCEAGSFHTFGIKGRGLFAKNYFHLPESWEGCGRHPSLQNGHWMVHGDCERAVGQEWDLWWHGRNLPLHSLP